MGEWLKSSIVRNHFAYTKYLKRNIATYGVSSGSLQLRKMIAGA